MATTELNKLVKQVAIKSNGDAFHKLFVRWPHYLPDLCPTYIKNVSMHAGEWGSVGSVVELCYTHDGKNNVAKVIITSIDEENKSVSFMFIEGDILNVYESFFTTVHVDTSGEKNLVTWTFEYEKPIEHAKDLTSCMDFCISLTKNIDSHHLTN